MMLAIFAAIPRGLPALSSHAYCNPVMPRDPTACDEDLMLAYRDGSAAAFDELARAI